MNRIVLASVLATCLSVLLAPSASATQFYKWKDQNGVWQYTTSPPPAGAESKTVSVQGDVKTDSPTVEPNKSGSPAQAANAEKATTPSSGDMSDEIRQKRAELCENAKKRVEILRNNAVVELDKDGDGVGERLSPEDQSAELSKAMQGVTVYCAAG
jgi:hypothetical protein